MFQFIFSEIIEKIQDLILMLKMQASIFFYFFDFFIFKNVKLFGKKTYYYIQVQNFCK